MGKFVITKRSNGEYQFNLKADNGQIILTSEGYSAKSGCLNGIDSVRTNSAVDSRFERKISSNRKHYFVLKAANSQVIGNSELYESASAMENGIQSVKNNAPRATVDDQTN